MPPLLLIHGKNERLYAQGVAMARKLAETRSQYDFIEIDGAPHGIENWEGRPQWLDYKKQLVQWLRTRLEVSVQPAGKSANAPQVLPSVLPPIMFDKFGPGIREQVAGAYEEARRNPNDANKVGRLAMILHSYEEFELAANSLQAGAGSSARRISVDLPFSRLSNRSRKAQRSNSDAARCSAYKDQRICQQG